MFDSILSSLGRMAKTAMDLPLRKKLYALVWISVAVYAINAVKRIHDDQVRYS